MMPSRYHIARVPQFVRWSVLVQEIIKEGRKLCYQRIPKLRSVIVRNSGHGHWKAAGPQKQNFVSDVIIEWRKDEQCFRFIVQSNSKTPEGAKRDWSAIFPVAGMRFVCNNSLNRGPELQSIGKPATHMLIFQNKVFRFKQIGGERRLTRHKRERL